MPRKASPLSSNNHRQFYLKLYFYSSHIMSFAWSVLYYMSLCLFCFLVCHKCRCTKVGVLLLTPLLVHGQSEPRAAATLSRAEEGSRRRSRITRQPKQRQDQKHKEKEDKVDPPAKPLA